MTGETEAAERDAIIEWLKRIQEWRGYVSPHDLVSLGKSVDTSSLETVDNSKSITSCSRVCVGLPCVIAGANDLDELLGSGTVRSVQETCLHRCWMAPARETGIESRIPDAEEQFSRYISSGGYSVLRSCISGRRTPESVAYSLSSPQFASLEKTKFPLGVRMRRIKASGAEVTLVLFIDEFRPAGMSQTYFIRKYTHKVLEGLYICASALNAREVVIHSSSRHSALGNMLNAAVTMAGKHGVETPTKVICANESNGNSGIIGSLTKIRSRRPLSAVLTVGPEILSFVPEMLSKGTLGGNAAAFSEPPALFSITGSVTRPGVYLGHVDITVSELIATAGGVQRSCEFYGFIAGEWDNRALPARFSVLRIDAESLRICPLIAFPIVVLCTKDKIQRPVAFAYRT